MEKKIEKIIENLRKILKYAADNPLKTIVISVCGIAVLVALYLFINWLVTDVLSIVFVIWLCSGCPIPNFGNTQQVALDCTACKELLLNVMSEVTPQIQIIKPFGVDSMHFADKFKPFFYAFTFDVFMDKNAPADDVSLAENRFIVQERIEDKLKNDENCEIIPNSYNGMVSLQITSVNVVGKKYKYECVWVDNQEAYDFVCKRLNTDGRDCNANTPPNDDIF